MEIIYRDVVVKLILVISSLAAKTGKIVAVCRVQAEASHSSGHQTSEKNDCIEKRYSPSHSLLVYLGTKLAEFLRVCIL